jgi:hypothetical protein
MKNNHFLILLVYSLAVMYYACDDDPQSSNDSNQAEMISTQMDMALDDMEVMETSNQELYAHCTFYDYVIDATVPQTYPDDALTRDDDSTGTGLRLDMSTLPWSSSQTPFVQKLLESLDRLDGWGVNAGILMRFTQGISHINAEMSHEQLTNHVQLIMLDDHEALPNYPRHVPLQVRVLQEGKTLIFEPLFPLKSATRYGIVIKTYKDQEDPNQLTETCLAQSDVMRDILNERSLPRLSDSYQALQEASQWQNSEMAAATIFTTQSAHQTSFEIADYIRTQNYTWQGNADCESDGEYRHCTRLFEAHDFRKDGIVTDPRPQQHYSIKVHVWLPKQQQDPLATVLYGHGIGGDYTNAYQLINLYRQPKFVILAIDALHHGEHPTNSTQSAAVSSVLNFFALDVASQTINALNARDHFRQSTYDKLQLIQLLHQDGDLDGDGQNDVNTEQLGYYGLSLGGIMGVELLALESRIRASILVVSGAKLVTVLTEGDLIGDFLPVIYQLVGGQEVFETFIPLAQVLIDPADPATYAPFILHQRLDDSAPPHLLMQMAMNDEVVPNAANRALARALLIPHAQPHASDISFLPSVESPVRLNLYDRTVALFQFDRVLEGNDAAPSNHNNVPFSKEAHAQSKSFINQWINKDEPSVNDPYPLFDTPALD